jgi:hypothetical protein
MLLDEVHKNSRREIAASIAVLIGIELSSGPAAVYDILMEDSNF